MPWSRVLRQLSVAHAEGFRPEADKLLTAPRPKVPAIKPRAPEIAGNAIDENCDGVAYARDRTKCRRWSRRRTKKDASSSQPRYNLRLATAPNGGRVRWAREPEAHAC